MASSGERHVRGAATTFRRDEVDAVNKIFELISHGGDPAIVARSEPARSAWAKFVRMRDKLRGKTE